MEILYSIEATGKTQKDAIKHFVSEHWAEPRKVGKVWNDGKRILFNVKNGTRTYEVLTIAPVRFTSLGVYQIAVVE